MPTSTPAVEAITAPATSDSAERAHQSLIDRMRVELAAQPKRTVKVRNDGDVFVQINGYSFLIQPDVKVSVPEPVADLLDEAGYI